MTTSDTSTLDMQRDHAFFEALKQLFIDNPLHESAHEMHHAVRFSALRKAKNGGYRDYAADGMQRWRRQVAENAAEDWNVPPEQVVAVHVLIYG